MIVVAEAVAANAAAIAIWLMRHACLGRPLVGVAVNVTVEFLCYSRRSSWLRMIDIVSWDAVRALLDGRYLVRCVIPCLALMCMCCLYKVPLGRWVSCFHNCRTVGHPLKFPSFRRWGGWLAIIHPLFSHGSWWQDQCVKVSAEQF